MTEHTDKQSAEAFTRFWSDMVSAMATGTIPPPVDPIEAGRQMQRAFLDAMAQHCDQYLRSPQYLELLKKSMDGALAFRRQVDRFVRDAHQAMPSPVADGAGGSTHDLAGLERRLTERIEALEAKLESLAASGGRPVGTAGKARKPATGGRPRSKAASSRGRSKRR